MKNQNYPKQIIQIMNKLIHSFKIGSSKHKKSELNKNTDFLSLDVNGRSCSPQNIEQNPYDHQIELFDNTFRVNYDNKKFKVRTPSNFVKTAHNWKNMPYQRIRNVQHAIQLTRKRQNLAISDRGATILPQFQHFSPSTSPKTTQKRMRIQEKLKIHNRLQSRRLKQIQQVIKNSKQEQNQKQSIIKFEQKIHNLQSKEFIDFFNDNNSSMESPYSRRERHKDVQPNSKSTLYAYMVKTRKKLSERRHSKKKSVDYSLLGRINNLQEQQEGVFLLRNSIDRDRFIVKDE